MIQEGERSGGGLVRWIVFGVFILPMICVLGIGPAERLNRAGILPDRVMSIYEPLAPAAAFAPKTYRVMKWDLWDVWGCRWVVD
jgi:hypothetical protein